MSALPFPGGMTAERPNWETFAQTAYAVAASSSAGPGTARGIAPSARDLRVMAKESSEPPGTARRSPRSRRARVSNRAERTRVEQIRTPSAVRLRAPNSSVVRRWMPVITSRRTFASLAGAPRAPLLVKIVDVVIQPESASPAIAFGIKRTTRGSIVDQYLRPQRAQQVRNDQPRLEEEEAEFTFSGLATSPERQALRISA